MNIKLTYREVRFVLPGDGKSCLLHVYIFIECDDPAIHGWRHRAFSATESMWDVINSWKADPKFEAPLFWDRGVPASYKEL